MIVIRAHFDGSVIVPDEPVTLLPEAQVVVLVDSIESSSTSNLENATREYYQRQSLDESDDEGWGKNLAHDSREAWEEE